MRLYALRSRALLCTIGRSACFVVAAIAGLAVPAAAQNLIDNAGFDDDIDGWSASEGIEVTHDDADELGNPASGSLVVRSPTGQTDTISSDRCLEVIGGETYVFGASVRIPEGLPVSSAAVGIDWYHTPNCTSSAIGANEVLPYFVRRKGSWGTTQVWAEAPAAARSALFRLRAIQDLNSTDAYRVEFDNVFLFADATCGPSPTTLCLNHGRFRVIAEWQTAAGDEGHGRAVQLTDDSGYFWFFNDANVELVTKLLDACPTQFNRFWFFAAGLTDVHTLVLVRDTQTDTERLYQNPQQTPFQPIQDTNAFATCP